ncbi:tripartite tricarboxylate transporter substrate binding protein [Roseomonas sp. CAU 1739]|uniref:Bug family tripartite tricarboxylate transporter substrate binding protein n=1 Tax=Roseomonas sp. CAU 1739 TaxID=3140364 RepID=UPI00325BBA08
MKRRTALSLVLLPVAARAQAPWPTRPIRLIVPFAPGGTTDVVGRIVAEKLGARLGQPVIVENRAGAGATIGAQAVARAEPDGLTLLVSSSTSHGVSPALYPNIPYDALRDFTHVGMIARSPSVLLVNPNSPVRTLADFAAAARAAGEVRFAVAGIGTSSHLAGVRLAMALGVRTESIPYRGAGPALTDLIGGVVPAMMDSLPSSGPQVRAGALRALAVSGAERADGFADLPTLREGGLDVVSYAWFGISGPANLPRPIVDRLSTELRAVLTDPPTRARLEELGGAPPDTTPESYTAFIRDELAAFAPLVRAAGLQPQ